VFEIWGCWKEAVAILVGGSDDGKDLSSEVK
jgi:hypothetical protein